MSLEARVNTLEYAFHENNKILGATHGVVSLVLNEQRENHKDYERFKLEVLEFIRQQNKRTDKIEELLIQIVNNLASK